LVYGSDNRLYLRDDPCLPDGLSVSPAPIANVNDAQMVKVGNDTFYIAVNSGAALNYYRVSGSSSTLVATVPAAIFAGGRFQYTLDGEGRLYVAVDTDGDGAPDQVDIYNPNNTTGIPDTNTNAFGGNNVVAMLGFANRVLVRDNAAPAPNLYDIQPNATVTPLPADATLQQHFNNCTDVQTKAVDGIGTNFIRCLYDQGTAGGNGQRLSSIAFVGGQYRRPNALEQIAPAPAAAPPRAEVAANDILFGANALIVRHATDNRVRLCTTTSTTNPECW
jgi:hypothetical protein